MRRVRKNMKQQLGEKMLAQQKVLEREDKEREEEKHIRAEMEAKITKHLKE
jgi:hypothetical protein